MAELADRNDGYVRTAVSAPEVTVTVAGVVRKAESVSISAESGGGLPDQVASVGTGMLSRTGSVTWSSDDAVDREFGNPATALRPGGWPPAQGDPVTVDVTVGGKTWRRFTGRIGKTKGGIGTGSLVSEIADDIEARLTNPVTIPATHGDFAEPTFYAAEALRLAGIGPLPADPPPGAILYHQAASGISLVGDGLYSSTGGSLDMAQVVKAVGTASVEDTGSTTSGLMLFAEMVDLFDVSPGRLVDISLSSGAKVTISRGAETGGAIPITVSTNKGSIGMVPVKSGLGDITDLCVHISSTGASIQVWDGTRFVTISASSAVRVPVTEKVAQVYVDRSASATGVMLIRTNSTGTVMAEAQARPRHRISRPGSYFGNPDVGSPNQSVLYSTRSFVSTSSREILDGFCQAGAYSQWVDEYGRYVIRHPTTSVPSASVPPSGRPAALDEMVDASWSIDSSEVRSKVIVKHESGHEAGSWVSTVTSDAQVRSYGPGAFSGTTPLSVETWHSAPDDEEWGPLYLPVIRLTSQSDGASLSKDASYTAAQVRTETGTTWADKAATPVTVTSVAERVGPRSVKVTDTITKPAADAEAILAFPDSSDILYRTGISGGSSAPAIRAEWVTRWVDGEKTGKFTGPEWAPVYVHEAGAFLDPGLAQWTADYLSYWLGESRLIFDQIDMLWSPSRSIGESEEWDWAGSGVDLPPTEVLIAGISEEYQAGEAPTQTVTARVLRFLDTYGDAERTYQDLADQYPRYADIPSTRTYQDVYSALPERPA